MKTISFLLNLLICLIIAQIYQNHTFDRFHVLIVIFLFILAGICVGIYLAIASDEHIYANIETTVNDSGPLADKLLLYKIYDEINNVTNNLKRNRIDQTQLNENQNQVTSADIFADAEDSLMGNLREIFDKNAANSLKAVMNRENSYYLNSEHFEMDFYNNESKNDASNTKFDSYLDELVELIVKDFVMDWLGDLIWEKDKFAILVKNELKQSLINLFRCFRKIDYVKLISKDLVQKFYQHFFEVKRCSQHNEKFKLYTFELDRNEELKHLRNIIDIIILVLLGDRNYFKNNAIRSLLREIILHKLVMPCIEYFCNPDYINQQIIAYLEKREAMRQSIEKKFSYASSYEDFIRVIKTATNLDELRQFHFKIMNEIMQATIINNLKDQKAASNELKRKKSEAAAAAAAAVSNDSATNGGGDSLFDDLDEIDMNAIVNLTTMTNSSSSSSASSSAAAATASTSNKGNLLKTRNLPTYLKQLKYAKAICEKRLNNFMTPKLNEDEKNDIDDFESKLKNRKIYPFQTIIKSPTGAKYFMQFLESDSNDALLRFYKDVETLKNSRANTKKQYELANRIYENYLKNYGSPVRDEISRELIKQMQLFLLGNTGDEAFYVAQKKIEKVMERDHYHSFLVSDLYQNLVEKLEKENSSEQQQINSDSSNNFLLKSSQSMVNLSSPSAESQQQMNRNSTELVPVPKLTNHEDTINYANRRRIEHLQENLNRKIFALNAAKSNSFSKQDESTKIVELLENEIKQLKHEILTYESYLQKTAIWCENMGKWATKVVNARLISPSDLNTFGVDINEPTVFFEIQVELHDEPKYISGGDGDGGDDTDSMRSATMIEDPNQQSSEGWIIYRTYKQFENLHEILADISPYIKSEFKKIPNIKAALMGKSSEDAKCKSAISNLDHYLKIVSNDPMFSQSQAFYAFLCPSPEYSKEKNHNHHHHHHHHATNSSHHSMSNAAAVAPDEKFTITSLFRGNLSRELSADDDLDRLFAADDEMNPLINSSRDSIAEPFYYLLEELFEIKGMKKWFRKSLILFVQLTYGATINRKIRESINWMLSDEMFSHYIKLTRESFWSQDQETNAYKLIESEETVRLIEEKLKTKNMAKVKLLLNMPDMLQKLVGEKNAQIGVVKLFETFQDEKLNKHLVYSLLELFVNYIYPDGPNQDGSRI